MPKFKVSQSKLKVWRSCHMMAYYRYVLMLRSKRIKRPLFFGKIVHDVFDADINGDSWEEKLYEISQENAKAIRIEQEEYGDIINDIFIIMTEYFIHWKGEKLTYLRLRGKGSEHSFEVDIGDDLVVVGRIDNLARTKAKTRWLVERKTGRNPLSEDHKWRNIQSVVYTRIVDMIGLKPVDGTMWDFIRSKPPTEPQFTKTGKLSARMIDTLPLKVHQVAKNNGVPISKMRTLLHHAQQARGNWFERVYMPRKDRVVNALWGDFIDTAKDMRENLGKLKDRNIDRHCDWCEYEPLCRAALLGLDEKFLRKKEYYVHENDDEEEPDFEA